MEENHQRHHQKVPENRLSPLQHGIQHVRHKGSFNDSHKVLPEWTNNTRHDLITRNILPTPEITTSQELNTMSMHDKQWGTDVNSWKSQGTITKPKTWAYSSTKLTTPRSISTAVRVPM
jgi:hypothetical protein